MSISRRTVLSTAAALPAVSLLAGAPMASAATRNTFYISESGNDDAAGTSDGAPWKTIDRINKAFADGNIGHGDVIRFKRGERFYGEFPELPTPSDASSRLVFSTYGKGERPQIMGYKVLNKKGAWSKAGTNLWQIYLGDTNNYYGNTSSTEARCGNVGLLRVNNELLGSKKASVDELKNDWDFHSDSESKVLTICIPSNPTSYGDVRIAVDGRLIQTKSYVTIQGLDLIGTGGHGIQVVDSTGVKILNNRIRHIGGSELIGYSVPNTRYGNGVEVWIGSKDVLVASNIITDVYDVATTMQGEQTLKPDEWGSPIRLGWSNVHFKSNRITRCSQSFEVWSRGTDFSSESGFSNCSFTQNNCTDAGVGWGYEARPNKDEGGVHLLSYAEQLPIDITVTGNRFVNAVNAYIYRAEKFNTKMSIDENTIQLKAGQRLQAQSGEPGDPQQLETIEQHVEWSKATGIDANSTFIIE
jgi:hypothetical protein